MDKEVISDGARPGTYTSFTAQNREMPILGKPGIAKDLKDKLYEIRSKRDALMMSHSELKVQNDKYNKAVIILSLFTAFLETVKNTFEVGQNSATGKVLSISPIALSTGVAIISSLLKFMKLTEKMEELTKASEKCAYTITRIRDLQETIPFEDEGEVRRLYKDEILKFYQGSLESIEGSIYPNLRKKFYKTAQKNLLQIKTDEKEYVVKLIGIEKELRQRENELKGITGKKYVSVVGDGTSGVVIETNQSTSAGYLCCPSKSRAPQASQIVLSEQGQHAEGLTTAINPVSNADKDEVAPPKDEEEGGAGGELEKKLSAGV